MRSDDLQVTHATIYHTDGVARWSVVGGRRYFMIVSRLHGLVLAITGSGSGSHVKPWPRSGWDDQWWYEDYESGTIRSKLNGFCLEAQGNLRRTQDKKKPLNITRWELYLFVRTLRLGYILFFQADPPRGLGIYVSWRGLEGGPSLGVLAKLTYIKTLLLQNRSQTCISSQESSSSRADLSPPSTILTHRGNPHVLVGSSSPPQDPRPLVRIFPASRGSSPLAVILTSLCNPRLLARILTAREVMIPISFLSLHTVACHVLTETSRVGDIGPWMY